MERHNEVRKKQDLQKIFIKQCLLNKIFVGRYTERRLIQSSCKYADVIVVDQKDHEFISTLGKITEKLENCSSKQMDSCILGDTSEGYFIHTDLSGYAFGSYWFMIKNVIFTDTSISIIVECLRSYEIDVEPLTIKYLSQFWNDFNLSNFLSNFIASVSLVCTKDNMIQMFRFLSAVFLSVAVGAYELLQLLLKFFQEFNNTIHIFAPVLIAAIDGLSKAFGGLLIFFIYLFKKDPLPRNLNFDLQSNPKYLLHQNQNMRR